MRRLMLLLGLLAAMMLVASPVLAWQPGPNEGNKYSKNYYPNTYFNYCGIVFGFRVNDIEAASEELAEAGCELLGEITRNEEMNYAYRDFRGPDGRVYGINEQK